MSPYDYETYRAKADAAVAARKHREENMRRLERERSLPVNAQRNIARVRQARRVLERARRT